MSVELNKAIEDLGVGFEQFKATNDTRLNEIEKNGKALAETDAKLAKINDDLTALQALKDKVEAMEKAENRAQFGGGQTSQATTDHAKGFNAFMRTGAEDGLRDLEINAALTTQSDPDGGWTVPEEVDGIITRVEGTLAAMRRIARVQPVGSAVYKKLHNTGGSTSGWVGEEEARAETDTPSLKMLEFPTMELYANPAATQGMLDDSSFNVENWLGEEVAIEFAEQEGSAFINGSGVNKPRGILSYSNVINSNYAWEKIGFVKSGVSGDFDISANGSGDALIDLQHALKAGYRNNATFLMNDLTLAEVRKLKNVDGDLLWRPGLEAGASDTLLGKPVEIDDNMPDIAANSYSIAFGDFNRAYIITDRMGARILRDPYTNKPFVKFYTTKRVGGGVQDFAALKLMKFAA